MRLMEEIPNNHLACLYKTLVNNGMNYQPPIGFLAGFLMLRATGSWWKNHGGGAQPRFRADYADVCKEVWPYGNITEPKGTPKKNHGTGIFT